MTIIGTPLAIAFKEPDVPMAHVPTFGADYDETTQSAKCLRCGRMVTAKQWSREACGGE